MEEDFTHNSYDDTVVTRYGLGARGVDAILTYNVNGTLTDSEYPLYDAHGNMFASITRATSGSFYTTNNLRYYDPWGALTSGSNAGSPNNRHCANIGHKQDDETGKYSGTTCTEGGLIYMRARYYDSAVGRFISEDFGRHGINWAVYCGNNPVNRFDATGRDFEWDALLNSLVVSSALTAMLINSITAHTAAIVAIAGLIMLSVWFSDKYFVGDPNSEVVMAAGMLNVTLMFKDEMIAIALHGGEGEVGSSIAQKCMATVYNYGIILGLFIYLEFGV